MKSFLKNFIFVTLIFQYGCEEVVNIDLEEGPPRLVIEASILIDKDNPASSQIIRLTTTAPFYDEEVPPAEGAEVIIIGGTGNIYEFTEVEPGYYKNNNFRPVFNTTYNLEIEYEGEIYKASEELISVTDLEFVEQNNNGGFGGDEIELRAFYTDPAEEKNYYLFRFLHEDLNLQIYDDEFTDGNQTFAVFSEEDLEAGEDVRFEIQGISRRFYEYMYILRSQAGTGGGPFQTQPTTVRGNIVNITNPENFPFGYFRLSQIDFLDYNIQ